MNKSTEPKPCKRQSSRRDVKLLLSLTKPKASSSERPANALPRLATRFELTKSYVRIVKLSFSRLRPRRKDFEGLAIILLLPALYGLRFKGELSTPIGRVRVPNAIVLRSFIYGFFKSYFCYGYTLERLTQEPSYSTVVDVGANIGDFSLSVRHISKRALAFEPGKQNFLALCGNLSVNKAINVTPIRAAAHHREEIVSLGGWNSDLQVLADSEGEKVKAMPLE